MPHPSHNLFQNPRWQIKSLVLVLVHLHLNEMYLRGIEADHPEDVMTIEIAIEIAQTSHEVVEEVVSNGRTSAKTMEMRGIETKRVYSVGTGSARDHPEEIRTVRQI